jgi:hypothetical protein
VLGRWAGVMLSADAYAQLIDRHVAAPLRRCPPCTPRRPAAPAATTRAPRAVKRSGPQTMESTIHLAS